METGIISVTVLTFILAALFLFSLYKTDKEEKEAKQQEIQRKEIVKSTSELLKSLKILNEKYHFHTNIKKEYRRLESFSAKGKFDRYNCSELFDRVVYNEYAELCNAAKKIQENRTKYESYIQQIRQLHSTVTPEFVQQYQIPFEVYRGIEDQLFGEYQLKPIINSYVICIAQYISAKGRKQDSKQESYSVLKVARRYQEIQEIVAQKNSAQEQKKRERAKMSASLRYDILQRDGCKCQICGRTKDDGVKLHVDHIIPIAKGGKTEPSNLRTLCDQCNLGKRDKTE